MDDGRKEETRSDIGIGAVENSIPADGFSAGRLASMISRTATASTIFGDPVRQGQNVIVPVAKATWGVGGGRNISMGEEGGGGGVHIVPVGFIQMDNKRVRFRRIRGPAAHIGTAAVLVGALALLAAALGAGRK